MNTTIRQAIADTAEFRIIGKHYSGLLGPEYDIAADGKYWRCGELSLNQLKRGIPVSDLELLEIDTDGEPV